MKRFVWFLLAPVLLFAACSPHPDASPSGSAAARKVVVFASTNVWGSVAQAVGGDFVDVHASITKPDQDPHDYEATAQDKDAVTKAAVVIVNGGGYDDWASTLAKGTKGKLIDAVAVSGLKHGDDKDFNEHVFYSLDTVKKVADEVAAQLSSADAAHAGQYTANATSFDAKVSALKSDAAKVGAGKNLTAFATEPVTGYLMEDMGIKNVTPDDFVEESETQAGPSTKVQAEAQEVIKSGAAKLLVLNAQTETDVTKALGNAATAGKVPVVKVTETFPDGVTDYTVWVSNTISAFDSAAKQVK